MPLGYLVASGSATSVLTGVTTADQITGTYQFTGPGLYSLYAKSSATGMFCTWVIGGNIVINDQPIIATGTAGTIDFSANPTAQQRFYGLNMKNEFKLRNSTGGTLTTDWAIYWDPLLPNFLRRR